MTKTLIKLNLTTLLALIGLCNPVFGQTNNTNIERQITSNDSVLLHRYLDSINISPLYSQKRQKYYDSALSIKPWKASWWQQKAMPLFKQKKYEIGMVFLDSAVKYDRHRYIDYRAFIKCIFQKSYRDAIKDFEASKECIGAGAVMDHSYDFYIGLCYLQLNQLDSSIFFLTKTINDQKKAIGEDWVHPLDLFYLGIVYYEKEDYAKALESFDYCLKMYPDFSDAEYYKAVTLKKSNKPAEALVLMTLAYDHFKTGYTINEDNVDYEIYPYQVYKRSSYEGALKWLGEKVN
jgi:tetratricopeptide (TPR) repeat protein